MKNMTNNISPEITRFKLLLFRRLFFDDFKDITKHTGILEHATKEPMIQE